MDNTMKALTAGIAAVIASAAMISTASAATYIDRHGNIYYDNSNDCAVYYEDSHGNYRSHSNITYVGEDYFCGSVFYDPVCGYYSYNGGDSYDPLGWDFTLTEYYGTDTHGRYIFHNDTIGYFILKGDNYIPYGFDPSDIVW